MTPPPLLPFLCLMLVSTTVSMGAFAPLLPEMATVGGLADWELGIVAGVFGFARTLSDVPAGLVIARRLRRALVLAPLVFLGGVACLGSGGPFPLLVLGRGLMGVGHTLGMLAGLTAILRYSAAARVAWALNVYEFSGMLGMLGGVVLVGALPARLPWNLALVVTCAPQVLGLVALPFALRALPPEPGGPALAPPAPARALAGSSSRRSPLLLLAMAAGSSVALTYSSIEQFILPLRSSREFGLGRAGISRLFMTIQLTDIVALLPVGFLSDRWGAPRMVAAVLLSLAGGGVLLAFGPLWLVPLGCVLFGLGMAGWMLPLSLLRAVTAPERIAWVTALYRVTVDGGMFVGPFVSGFLGRRADVLPGTLALVMAGVAALLLRYAYRRP